MKGPRTQLILWVSTSTGPAQPIGPVLSRQTPLLGEGANVPICLESWQGNSYKEFATKLLEASAQPFYSAPQFRNFLEKPENPSM